MSKYSISLKACEYTIIFLKYGVFFREKASWNRWFGPTSACYFGSPDEAIA